MILTPIPSERLPETLRQFRDSLADAFAREILDRIAATSPGRAAAEVAETHRQQNWLKGAGTERAAAHFVSVLRRLSEGGFVDRAGQPTRRLRQEPDEAAELRAA
jgi:hypothetical protein